MPADRIPPASLIKDFVKKNNKFNMVALGSSMIPVIWHRSNITIEWKEPSNIKVGDIIAKGIGQKYIIHRVVRIKKVWDNLNREHIIFITKGDFLTRNDPLYDIEEYIGIVTNIKNRFVSFNPNAVRLKVRKLCAVFSRSVNNLDKILSPFHRFIYKIRIFRLIYRTILSFPVLIINTVIIILYSFRR